MIILVSGATGTHNRFWDNLRFGHLITPRSGNSIRSVAGKAWGADNDAFGGWSEQKGRNFSKMLGRICRDGTPDNCKFIAIPDEVANARVTLERFRRYAPMVKACGFPIALVAQDGIGDTDIPWDEFDSLFIGGTTDFKLSQEAEELIVHAKSIGKWVHVGRVNTLKRFRHFVEIGADSSDGTSFSKWPDKYFPAALRWLDRLERQKSFLSR